MQSLAVIACQNYLRRNFPFIAEPFSPFNLLNFAGSIFKSGINYSDFPGFPVPPVISA